LAGWLFPAIKRMDVEEGETKKKKKKKKSKHAKITGAAGVGSQASSWRLTPLAKFNI
jgi:hypothetical protein